MQWRDLVFLHWPVPLARPGPLVPPELTLDAWRGVAYVSLVAFNMRMRPVLVPDAFAMDTHEINLRTYVHYNGQPGVYFLSLDTDSWLATAGGRALFGLPYHDASIVRRDHGPAIELSSRRRMGSPARFHVLFRPGRPTGPARPGTLAHFLLERYALYVDRALTLWRVQVRHAPYPAQRVSIESLEQDLLPASTLPQPEHGPRTAHYALGVDVSVLRPELVAITTSFVAGSRRATHTRTPRRLPTATPS